MPSCEYFHNKLTSWFPRGLENLENEKTFSSQGIFEQIEKKSGNFTQNTGKMRTFYPKYWKSEGI